MFKFLMGNRAVEEKRHQMHWRAVRVRGCYSSVRVSSALLQGELRERLVGDMGTKKGEIPVVRKVVGSPAPWTTGPTPAPHTDICISL